MKPFMTVYDEGKTSSSWLTKGIQLLSSIVLGVNTFKDAWKSAPDAANALAASNNTTVDNLRTRLRMAGIDPDVYFDTLTNNIAENGGIDNMDSDAINAASAAAQNSAQDSGQKLWLIAGLALILILGLGSHRRTRRRITRSAVRVVRRVSFRRRRRSRRYV